MAVITAESRSDALVGQQQLVAVVQGFGILDPAGQARDARLVSQA